MNEKVLLILPSIISILIVIGWLFYTRSTYYSSQTKPYSMYKKTNTKKILFIIIPIVLISMLIGWLVVKDQPGITKKYLPAQAEIISSKKIQVQSGKSGRKWVVRHKAYFRLDDYDYAFHFTCKIGAYHTGDSVDIFYNPKRPRTVIVYSIPEDAIILAEGAQLDHIYLYYEDVKAFFDSVRVSQSKKNKMEE